jgi:hypothetical protein
MALPDIRSKLQEEAYWLEGQELTAYLAGVLLGVRLSRQMVEKELSQEWDTGLNLLARQTFMGEMRQWGMTLIEFQQGLQRGSYGMVSLADDAFPHPQLMERQVGTKYAAGILTAVNLIYIEGTKYFINGIAFGREEGPPAYHEWINQQEGFVAALLQENERQTA